MCKAGIIRETAVELFTISCDVSRKGQGYDDAWTDQSRARKEAVSVQSRKNKQTGYPRRPQGADATINREITVEKGRLRPRIRNPPCVCVNRRACVANEAA